MGDMSLITFFVNFFVNDIFGHVYLSVIFLIGILLAVLWISRSPKISISIMGLFLISTLTDSGYVPVWVGIMTWAVLGLLWGQMFIKMVQG